MASRLWPEGQGLRDALPLRCEQAELALGAEALDQATPPETHGITSSRTDPAVLSLQQAEGGGHSPRGLLQRGRSRASSACTTA